jgi:hypothetical protein
MKRSMYFVVALLVVGGMNLALHGDDARPAAAKDDKTNVADEKGKEGSAAGVALLNQAGELVQYARENESPLAMLTAVQIIRRVPMQDGEERVGEKQEEQAQGQARREGEQRKDESAAAPSFDTKALLEEAREMAEGNEHVLALIDAEMKKPAQTGTLGAESGPIVHRDSVRAITTDQYRITFRGGEVARVAVIGDGDTDLDLYIIDENGNLITRDIDRTDRCVAEWTPRWTGVFLVRIQNLGLVHNNYVLMTN